MKKRESISPDLTPLIDVIFIILIFFIVSSVLKKEETALFITLPTSQASQKVPKTKQLIIEISKNNFSLEGKIISLKELENRLKSLEKKKQPITIRSDKETTYKRIVVIFDLLQKYSLHNLILITDTKKQQ